MNDEARPEPDRLAGAPHPRETQSLFGQAKAEAEFLAAFNSGRMHSGWLVTGPRGIGKATLAWKIAGFLLAQPVGADAGLFGDALPPADRLALPPDHPDMRLIASGAHPRLFLVRRPYDEKSGKLRSEITVDPVRDLKNFFHMSAADGGRRVVIVDAADEMNRSAANAILKELEEPPANTVILMIAHQPSRLLPTIRSRCRELRLATLSAEDMAKALEQADIDVVETEALAALSGGSVGDAIRLIGQDGLSIYAELVRLFADLPRINRQAALKLAESCAGKGAEARFPLVLDLVDLFLARLARAGVQGEPSVQGASGEARLLARLAPDPAAARRWAALSQDLGARLRHGRAVNLDPAALILDMVFKIEATAKSAVPA